MDDLSDPFSGIPPKTRHDAQIGQLWDDDSGFWEDPATLSAIEELTIAEVKEAAHTAKREQPTAGGPPPTTPLRNNGRRSSGQATSSPVNTITAATLRPSQSPQSRGMHTSCRVATK